MSAETLLKRWSDLKLERAKHEPAWRDAAFFVRSNSAPDREYGQRPYDGEALRCAHRLAAGLIGAIMNPGAEWFALTTKDADLDADEECAAWIEHVTDEIQAAFRDPAAGWIAAIHEMALDLVSYGTGLVTIDEHPTRDGIATICWPLWKCWLACDIAGQIDTVFRERELPARIVEARWPKLNLESARRLIDAKKPDAPIKLLYVILPWDDLANDSGGAKKTFASIVLSQQDKAILTVEGRDEMPVFAPRWSTDGGETYGIAPVHLAMPDIKTQNNVVESWIASAELRNRPPLLADEAAFLSAISLNPGALNMVDMGGLSGKPLVPLELGIDLAAASLMRDALRKDIAQTLLADLWQLPNLHNMTATEIMRRMQLHAQALGPIVGRLTADLLGPAIQRVFAILKRQGKLRAPPPSLDARALSVTYLSPLTQESRLAEAQGTLQLLQMLPTLAAADPNIARAVDYRQALALIARGLGAPLTILKPLAQYRQESADALDAQRSIQAQQEAMTAASVAQKSASALGTIAPHMASQMGAPP